MRRDNKMLLSSCRPLRSFKPMLRKIAGVFVLFVMAESGILAANLPPLVEAAKTGNRDVLKSLLQKGSKPNDADGDGSTALHWAAYRNDAEMVDLLVRAGANVNAVTDLGVTALWTASQNGGDVIVKRLLDGGANPNLALTSGETPLMVAARGGYAATVQLLAAKGANVNAKGTRNQTALMWAASQSHPEVVKVLLAFKPDLKAVSETWFDMQAVSPHSFPDYNKLIPHGAETALMFAVRVGDAASTKLLLDAGANPNDADAWGVSATTLATHSNFGDVAELLLNAGADPNAMKAGFSALHNAIMWRNEKTVTALLARGADPNLTLKTWTPSRRTSKDYNYAPELVGASPLWLAARYMAPGIMRALLEKGADPKFVHHGDYVPDAGMSKDGVFVHRKYETTPLMAALGMGGGDTWAPVPAAQREALVLECVKLAAAPGVNLNLANTDGKTALDGAKGLRFNSVLSFLTERGAKAGVPLPPPPDVSARTETVTDGV